MSKELYMDAHEALVDEEMERTGCDWQTAYDCTADRAYDRMRDNLGARIDEARQRLKDEGRAAPVPFRSADDARRFADAIIGIQDRRNAEIARGQK